MSTGVVLVNWNGWADTVECLESLLRSRGEPFRVVVCDNASTDGSVERIAAWAEGREPLSLPAASPFGHLMEAPVPKPVPFAVLDRADAEAGELPDPVLTLLRVGANAGFAGANNVGMRYLMRFPDVERVWLLNNDTVVAPDALAALVRASREQPDAGMIGSKLLVYDAPERVQAVGGATYNAWLALPRHVGEGAPADAPVPADGLRRMRYVVGASMLVPVAFLRDVGLMSEEYFLYFEELDWAMRARGRWRVAAAPDSVVYHKEGRSVGGRGGEHEKSWTADFHFMRSRLLFTRKFFPARLPTVYLALGVAMLRRARRGRWDRVAMIARLCLKG